MSSSGAVAVRGIPVWLYKFGPPHLSSFRATSDLLVDTQESSALLTPSTKPHGFISPIVDFNHANSETMPVSRMRMRPWLEHKIDSNTIPGLRWLDKERTMFSIPWKHAARHGWELNKDASLFKEWAKHTGKYVEGQNCDPKTWKANFRCAMNSLPDIEEVKNKSINKGHQAVRVFRMLPVTPKSRERRAAKQRRQSKVKYEEDSSDSDYVPSPSQAHLPSPQNSHTDIHVDSTLSRDQPDTTFMLHDDVPRWSTIPLEFELPRKFEVSPAHSPDDEEIIEICAQWENERHWENSHFSNGFLNNEAQCTSPGSLYSDASSADELEEVQYTNLDTTFPLVTESVLDICNAIRNPFSL